MKQDFWNEMSPSEMQDYQNWLEEVFANLPEPQPEDF
jgi:hypothetical protein